MKSKSLQLVLVFLFSLAMASGGCKKSGGGSNGLLFLLLGGGSKTPRVVSSLPADASAGVSITPTISARFSRDMDASTITSSTFTVTGGTLGAITGTVAYDAVSRTATFTLVSPANLEYLTAYTVLITDDARDTKGTYLANDVQWIFTTVAEGTVPAPEFGSAVLPGTHDAAVDVTITCDDGSATIMYTIDESAPSITNGTEYTGAIHVSQNTLIRAMAYRAGWNDSSVTDGQYNIRTPEPAFSIDGDQYDADQSVTLTASGAIIYYTLAAGTVSSPPADPADPTTSSSTYGSAIPVAGHNTMVKIKALALAPNMAQSNVVSETYTIVYGQVAAPAFKISGDTVTGGTYTGTQTVAIESTTSGNTIHFTTDGVTEPSRTVGTEYTAPVEISANTTLKAIAFRDGMVDSAVTTGAFNIRVAMPDFTPPAGTHSADIDIVISSDGDHIYYETTSATGSTPDDPDDPTTSSAEYSTAIPVHGHTTIVKIKAIATRAGMTQSEVRYGEFLIDWSEAEARWGEAIWGIHKWNP